MNKGYVNWKLVIVLVLGMCAVGATVVGLRKFNRTQRADQGLKTGLEAYEAGNWKAAASGLGQYLSIHQEDVDVLLKYGYAQAHITPMTRQRHAQAVNAYRLVLRIEQDNLEAAIALTDLYLQARAPGEAELVASRFLEHQHNPQMIQRLASAKVMQRQFEPAVELLTGVIDELSDQVGLYELLAHIAQERPELLDKTAQQWIDRAVENNPDNPEAYLLRGTYLARRGLRQQALADFQRADRLDMSDVEHRLSLAMAFLRIEATEEAAAQLDAVFDVVPERPELWQLRAMLAGRKQDSALSRQVAEDGLAYLGDENTVFLPYAVELFLQAGAIDKAREAMTQLRDADDVDRGLVSYLDGLLAEQEGNWSRAMAQWREAIIQGYTNEPVYLKLAEAAVRLEDRTTAVETLRRYIHQNPRSFSAQVMLTRILIEARRWAEAGEYAAAAVRLNPDSQEARNLQGRCRIELLQSQPQAQRRIDALLDELLASDDSLQNRLLELRVAMNRRQWDRAKPMLDALRGRFSSDVQVWIAEAEFYIRQEQPSQAVEILDEAIVKFPDAAEPVIVRASMLSEEERFHEALTLLQKATARTDGRSRRRITLWMADLLRRTGQTDTAIEMFRQVADDNPYDILARRQLLSLSRDSAAVAQLQEWVDQIQAIEGKAGRLWKIEQTLLWMTRDDIQRRYTQIVTLLNENLAANPDDKQTLMLLAAAHEQAGNLRLAVSLYRDTLTRHSGDIDLAIAAMGAMHRAEEFRQADQLLNELLSAGHADPRLAQLELRGHLLEGRLDTAEDLLEKMLARDAADGGTKLSLALIRTRNGQFETARTLIDELIADDPDAVIAHAALADWYLQQDRSDDALAVCNAYLERNDTVAAYRLRARVLLAMGRQQEGLADIEHLVAHAAEDAEELLSITELYISAGLRDKALAMSRRALALAPDSFDAQKQTAVLLLASADTRSEGVELLEKALAARPRDAQLRLHKAAMLLQRGDNVSAEQAVTILNALVNEAPRLEAAWNYLVEWYLRSEQAGMAMDSVLRGLAALPESRTLMLAKARIEGMRSPAVALETLTQLTHKYPDDGAVAELRAQMLRRLGRADEAVGYLRDWLTANTSPTAERMKLVLMEALVDAGQMTEAQAVYQQLAHSSEMASVAMVQWLRLTSSTADVDTLFSVFKAWYDAHPDNDAAVLPAVESLLAARRDEAQAAAETIIALVQYRDPDSPHAAFALAMLRHMTGHPLQAVGLYERTLELDPGNVVAMNNLAWILSQEKGDHAAALELADKGLNAAPEYTDLIDTRGTILYALGRYEQAAEDFRQAAQRYPDGQPQKVVSTFYYAKSLRQSGRNEQAQVAFFNARELDQRFGGLSEQQRSELSEYLRQNR